MQEVSSILEATIKVSMPFLEKITDEQASFSPSEGKWSPKEIIGHLVDSACNNQQKFVRMMAQPHLDFVGYAQNFWVEKQCYQQYDWLTLLQVWKNYNCHIAHIIAHAPAKAMQNTIAINGEGAFTLAFIMSDYVEHLKHHLKAVIPTVNLQSNFANVYNT